MLISITVGYFALIVNELLQLSNIKFPEVYNTLLEETPHPL